MNRIVDVRVTPIAFRDPPLLNVWGVHEPWALRSIIEVETDDGRIGLGESYGDLETLGNLDKVKAGLAGLDPFDLNGLTRVVYEAMGTPDTAAMFPPKGDKARATALAAFEVAFLDLQGQILGRPLYEVLGGKVRDRVEFSAYLFYKFEKHRDDPGYPADGWGECLSHEQMVGQARRMFDEYGFGSLKLKAGVFDPDYEIETLRASAPGLPRRAAAYRSQWRLVGRNHPPRHAAARGRAARISRGSRRRRWRKWARSRNSAPSRSPPTWSPSPSGTSPRACG